MFFSAHVIKCPMARMTKAEITEFFTRLRGANPTPKSDLEYTNAYTLLVAVVLSAQATDEGVNRATKDLFQIIDTPEGMVDLGLEGLKQHIKTIGLYNTKAQNVIKLSEILIREHNSKVPDTRDALVALPGVGRKTANVVLNIIFQQPTMAVDTHIFRISNRTGLAPGKNVDAVEQNLLKRVPDEFMMCAHHWLILPGRYSCKARKPVCSDCIVSDLCHFKDKTA